MLVYVVTAVAVLAYLALRIRDSHSEITRAVQKEVKELLLFISIIGGFFTVLQLAVDLMPVTPSDTLLSLERKIVWLRRLTDWLTMPAWVQALSFLGLLLFTLLSARMARLKALGRLSSTNAYVAKAHLFLILASALTFFGTGTANGAAQKQATLVAKIEETTRGYEETAKAVEKEAIRAAVAELTSGQTHPETAAFVTAVNTSRMTAKKIESADSRLPSEKDYASARADYTAPPVSYQISTDLSDVQKGAKIPAAVEAKNDRPPSSASVSTNQEVSEAIDKNGDAVPPDEFKTAMAESFDAAYDSSAGQVISIIAAHASTQNLPAQLLEVFLKKVVSDGFKEFLKDRVAETLTAIYEKHLSARETISAMREKVRTWVSSQNRADLSQIDQGLASRATEAAQSLQREEADTNAVARDFATARSRQLETSSRDLVSKVTLSTSSDIENIWTGIRGTFPSAGANYFERLGTLEKQHTIAVTIYNASDSTSDGGAVKSAAAIEYEILCCGTQRLSEAYAEEADRILASERRSYWGRVRAIAESSVAENTMNYDLSNLEDAKNAISNWRSFSAKIAVASAKGGSSADKLSPEQWDKWFAEYLTKHADMAALWGFFVISTPNDDRVWEPYYQERIQASKPEPIDFPKWLSDQGSNHPPKPFDFKAITPEDLDSPNPVNAMNHQRHVQPRQSEAQIREQGPHPRDGYRYFMAQMHVQTDADAEVYFSGPDVERNIDKFCPKRQRSRLRK